jgi:hypothetical protein
MRAKLEEVPVEVRRRAARHLEGIRGTPMAPGSKKAALGEEACPLYRPDVRGVAFWEIEVLGTKTATREPDGRRGDRAFIVVSTGRHDVPIPHWSMELEPPSRSLEAASEKEVARVLRADALAYVAEDARGGYLAHVGQMPMRPSGITQAALKELVPSSLESAPASASRSDEKAGEQKVKRSGTKAPRPKLTKWDSWGQLKKQFATAYRPQLQALADRAAQAWEIEDLVAKFGEGIHEGEKRVVPLLSAGKASLSGDGAEFVEMRVLDRRPPAVELIAGKAEERAEQAFELSLDYEDGSSERLPFFVIPRGTPSNRRRVLPHLQPLPPQP